MEKVFFNQNGSSSTSSQGTTRTSSRDSSRVSSRWKEVSEKTGSRKNSVERKRPGSQQSKKPTHLNKSNPEIDCCDEDANTSPFDLYGNMELKRKNQPVSLPQIEIEIELDEEIEVESDLLVGAFEENTESAYSELDLSPLKPAKDDKLIVMHEDTSFITPTAKSPSIASIQPATDGIKPKISAKTVSLIEELVQQIVDEVNILKVDGRTETTLTLKHPPMFAGSQVTITEFDTAKKEFNIKFENLSQEAHELISMQSNLDRLQSGLQQKGYNVHIVTANTEIEQPQHVFKGYNDRHGSDSRQEQHQHSDQQQEEQES